MTSWPGSCRSWPTRSIVLGPGSVRIDARLLVSCAVVLGRQFALLAGAIGVAGEGEDLGVVYEPVDHRGCDNVVRERLSPAPEGQIAGDHDRALFIPGRYELEE